MILLKVNANNRVVATYDGSVRDTAAVIGLYYQNHTKVDQIIFVGRQTLETMKMISDLNVFLEKKNWPLISKKCLGADVVEVKSIDKFSELGWTDADLVHILKLAGIAI
jgi:hypothetical protein